MKIYSKRCHLGGGFASRMTVVVAVSLVALCSGTVLLCCGYVSSDVVAFICFSVCICTFICAWACPFGWASISAWSVAQ